MNGTSARAAAGPEIRAVAEDLILEEAQRLDARSYDTWLDLFTSDAEYWVPLREGQTDPHSRLNIIFDDRPRMQDRIFRLTGGSAHAQDPPSRTVRNIAGLRYELTGEGELTVRSTFVLVEVRPGQQHVYGGRYTHVLRGSAERLSIARKTVELVNSEEPLGNLTFLL